MKKLLIALAVFIGICNIYAKEYSFKFVNESGKDVKIVKICLWNSLDEKSQDVSCPDLPVTVKDNMSEKIVFNCAKPEDDDFDEIRISGTYDGGNWNEEGEFDGDKTEQDEIELDIVFFEE